MKFKEKMVAKLTGSGAWSATALSRETGVSQATLSRWRRQVMLPDMTKTRQGDAPRQPGHRGRWTPERKVDLVMRAQAAGEVELGAPLRREGLYEEDLERF